MALRRPAFGKQKLEKRRVVNLVCLPTMAINGIFT
jgi:hypothetical protein